MASGDNTTEYKVKVTADTAQAEKNVKDLGDETQDTNEKFKSLRFQIRETTVQLQALADAGKVGTKEFETLRKKLDDLNDAQDRVNFQAGQFDDKLSALPGVLGQAGSALKTANDAIATFGKTLAVSLGLLGLAATIFLTFKKSLESTAKGQETLTRLTDAFQKILGPVLAVIESVALPLFEGLATILEKVGGAIANVVEGFNGVTKDKIKEASSGVKDFKKQAEELAKEQKAAADKAAAEAKQRAEKAKAAREKAAAEAKANREAAIKIEVESAINLLDEQNKEITQRTIKLNDDLLALQKAGITNTTQVWESYYKDKASIDKKYADEAKKKQDDLDSKTFEDMKALSEKTKAEQKKAADDARQLSFEQLQDQITDLDKKNAELDNDFSVDLERLEQKKTLLQQAKDVELSNTELTAAEKLKISRDYADKEIAVEKDITSTKKAETAARQAINQAYLGLAQQFGNALTQMAGDNKELAIAGVVISQAAAIGQIVSQTAIANAKAVAASPLTGGLPWVAINTISAGLSIATTISSAIKSIEQINAAPGPSAGGGGGSVGSAPSIQAPRVGTAATPQMAEGVGANPSAQIAQTIGNAQNQPVRAYVVSQDITSQQQLDRKVNSAAVF